MERVKAIMRATGFRFVRLLSYGLNLRFLTFANRCWNRLYWYALERRFKRVGNNCFIEYPAVTLGEQYITIGENFFSLARLRLEVWAQYQGHVFHPEIIIGDNVRMNYDCHIGCINQIIIGNNVLIAGKVFISDHFHGDISKESLAIPPILRDLTSKGPVIIEDNVWIGEGAVILPNVRIGRNAIIGANAVVAKDVPANCVVGGVPAQVIRNLAEEAE